MLGRVPAAWFEVLSNRVEALGGMLVWHRYAQIGMLMNETKRSKNLEKDALDW